MNSPVICLMQKYEIIMAGFIFLYTQMKNQTVLPCIQGIEKDDFYLDRVRKKTLFLAVLHKKASRARHAV